jgi:hypothetical protein
MRSLRSPLPIRPLRVAASLAARSLRSFSCSAPQHLHRLGLVAVLAPVVLAFGHDAGRQVNVMRIALSVLLTCWPPAPLARKVSMRRSAGFSVILGLVRLGHHGDVQALVWMRPWVSVAGTRCTRWPPDSNFSRP